VGRKMAGMFWHVGFLRSARATLEVVFHYLARQISRRIRPTFNPTYVAINELSDTFFIRHTNHDRVTVTVSIR
jgi:hypothetical protein